MKVKITIPQQEHILELPDDCLDDLVGLNREICLAEEVKHEVYDCMVIKYKYEEMKE